MEPFKTGDGSDCCQQKQSGEQKDYRQQTGKLKSQREGFARSNKDEQSKMAPAIRDLEKRVLQMSEELDKQAIEVRNAEKQNLK